METDLMHGCATRHAQAPLPQPAYSFAHVPKAKRDLEGSRLQEISNREHFHEAMGEMVLLCKEAMRRKPGKGPGDAKPLSLEYLADRLDIDDPCFGYLVRTGEQVGKGKPDPNWRKGMLQGFITVTTFTNWQHSFMWDSMNSVAYEYDDPEFQGSPDRVRDIDGALARELQATVRCGDILNEGIVWPRIAEISLLGGIGSGKALVEMLIEQLECMKPTPTQNYDYVVLQATDNSIPFYESLGFCRVGAVMLGGDAGRKESVINSFISCEHELYKVKTGETLSKIAAKCDVDVLDVIFLNKRILGKAKPSSKPLKNSVLMIPKKTSKKPVQRKSSVQEISWHVAKEDDTPKGIAQMYNVKCSDLVKANRGRFPELLANSRLKDGTRIKVSHFDVLETEYKAYAHWSFPDKLFEDPEPSYMMVRKLNRRIQNERNVRPYQQSLKAIICGYEKSELLLPPSPQKLPITTPPAVFIANPSSTEKRPLTPYMAFAKDIRGKTGNLDAREIRELWNDLRPVDRKHFEQIAMESRAQAHGSCKVDAGSTKKLLTTSEKTQYALYNKVVRLREDAIIEHPEYTYWYVLTFIPDLKWCHLAPMYQDGVFGPDKPRVEGTPRWRLVSEDLGREVDISSSYCIPIKSRSMRKTLDADKEEWCIIDDGTDTASLPITPRDLSRGRGNEEHALLPVVEPPIQESPSLLAYIPESTTLTTVTIVGKALFADDPNRRSKRGPGRPPKSEKRPQTTFASEPRRRHHARKRPTVQFDIPASARKAAALRTAAGMDSMDPLEYSKLSRRKSAPPTAECRGSFSPKQSTKNRDGSTTKSNGQSNKHGVRRAQMDDSSPIIGQAMKIAPMLQKTPDATEYFEPVIYESRLRRTSASKSTRPSLEQSPKRIIDRIKVAPELQKTSDASEYFEPLVFESRLRGRSGRKTNTDRIEHNLGQNDDLDKPRAESSCDQQSIKCVAADDPGQETSEHEAAARRPSKTSLAEVDYFSPKVLTTRLRKRVQTDPAESEQDTLLMNDGSNSYISGPGPDTELSQARPSKCRQDSNTSKKRRRSPEHTAPTAVRSSPRRVFSSTTTNSTPTKKIVRSVISPRSKRRKYC